MNRRRPPYVVKELRRPVEPFHSLWREAVAAFGFDTDRWQRRQRSRLKGEQLAMAQMLVKRLEQMAWETYPNPEYGEERAQQWEQEHQIQKKAEWGMSPVGSNTSSGPSTGALPSTPSPSPKGAPGASTGITGTENSSPTS